MERNQLIRIILAFSVVCLVFIGCKSEEVENEEQKREFARRLQEAQELAKQIRDGGLFDEETIKRQQVREPENVCNFTSNYVAVDFGASPDFRADGKAAIYNDNVGIFYYYDIENKQRYKMTQQFAKNPSFGMFLPDGKQKYIYQEFEKIKTDEGFEEKVRGLFLNNENDWLKPPQMIYSGSASLPYLVKEDKNVIFIQDGKCYLLDENLQKTQITLEEYNQLRDSRYELKHQWKLVSEYRGMKGLWITDLGERNWNQLRDLTDLETRIIVPAHYSVYCWGPEFAGLIEVLPSDLPNYSIRLNDNVSADIGDLFDVYEKKISPISQEVIGYQKEKYKGTLRVVRIVQGILVCEYQTKVYLSGVFKDDAAVSQKDENALGTVL